MVPYDYFDNNGLTSGLAWMLFTESGQPGYYLLYRDLLGLENETDDDRFR